MNEVEQYEGYKTSPTADDSASMMDTVPFRSIRPSRATHLGGLAEIETVSRVTGRFWAIFRVCEGSGSPRRERRAPYIRQVAECKISSTWSQVTPLAELNEMVQ